MKTAGIYLHYPFCRRACFYCHFFKCPYDRRLSLRYVQALLQEIERKRTGRYRIDTLYLGGGSPSLLSEKELAAVLSALAQSFSWGDSPEISLEANPEDLTPPKIAALRRLGINRLSIGVQSFQARDLHLLRRGHSASRARQAVEAAQAAGFELLNVDLIIGLETQEEKTLERNFHILSLLNIPHVSVYLLEGVKKRKTLEQEARDLRLYAYSRRRLRELGYRHYEVSNFCLPGRECRHNLKYWQNRTYLGLGAGAAGFEDGRDYKNVENLTAYFECIRRQRPPEKSNRLIDQNRRRLITGLRLLDGVPESGVHPFAEAGQFLLENEFLIRKGMRIAVHPDKILLLNEILGYFF